ncbi:MAG: hypothetical protein SGI77_02635 [Pirellulaceae bacterium]|nr:hypothetical protein [Pirellulaceae bacterium]
MMWRSLLWKDFRQVVPSAAICLAIIVLLQLIFLTNVFRIPHDAELGARPLASIGQILVVLACVGMAVGNERQSRIINWLSSMPIPWYRAFASQMLIAATCILVTIAVTQFIAMFAPPYPFYGQPSPFPLENDAVVRWMSVSELFLFALFFVLLFDEAIAGIVAAGIATVALNMIVMDTSETSFSLWLFGSNPVAYRNSVYGFLAVVHLLLAIGCALLYHWRWTTGQQTHLYDAMRAIFDRVRFGISGKNRAANSEISPWRTFPACYPGNSFWTLLMQTIRHSTLFFICVGSLPLLLALLEFWNDATRPSFYAIIPPIFLAGTLFGFQCFVGDHSRQRFRFLSDRGVVAWKVFFARTIPGFVILAAWMCIAYFVPENPNTPGVKSIIFLIAIASFFIANAAGLCVRNSYIGFFLAVTVSYFLVATYAILIFIMFHSSDWGLFEYFFGKTGFGNPYEQIVLPIIRMTAFLSASCYVILACSWILPTWFQFERSTFQRAIAFVLVVLLIPAATTILIACTYYSEPAWPSRRLSVAELELATPRKPSAVPFEFASGNVFEEAGVGRDFLLQWNHDNKGRLASLANFRELWSLDWIKIYRLRMNAEQYEKSRDWLKSVQGTLESKLAASSPEYRSTHEFLENDVTRLRAVSTSVAGLFRYAAMNQDAELLKEVLDCFQDIVLLSEMSDRISREEIEQEWLKQWMALSEEQLHWVDDRYRLRKLIKTPNLIDEDIEVRRYAIERAQFWEDYLSDKAYLDHASSPPVTRTRSSMMPDQPWTYRWPQALVSRQLEVKVAQHMNAELEAIDRLIDFDRDPTANPLEWTHGVLEPNNFYGIVVNHKMAFPIKPSVDVTEVLRTRAMRQYLLERVR